MTYFDHLATDTGYASTIETDPGDMVSLHQMKQVLKVAVEIVDEYYAE